jgi:hypothetical protein
MAKYVVELQGTTWRAYLKYGQVPKSRPASKFKRSSSSVGLPCDLDAYRCEIDEAHKFATAEGAQAFIEQLGLRPDQAKVKRIDTADGL